MGGCRLRVYKNPMLFLRSSGYAEYGMVFWELEGESIDFTEGEFEDLVSHLRSGRLFEFLRHRRPALRDFLLERFADSMREGDLEESDLEDVLESRILDLERRIRHA